MSVNLSPVAGAAAQFLDNSGNVLTGGKLYTYLAGTTTPAATYTSSLGVTFHSNPIILDAAGRVPNGGEIWLSDNVQYKFVLKDANDVLIGTWDNLVGINSNFVNYTSQEEIQVATAGQTVFNLTTVTYTPGTNSLQVYVDGVNQYDGITYAYVETDATTVTFTAGLHVGALVKFTTSNTVAASSTNANLVTYDPPFIGGVSTNVENKLAQYVSVKDFGAVGDGVANDTTAIQAALNASNSVYFPAGTYYIASTLNLPDKNITLRGEGRSSKIIGSVSPLIAYNPAFTTNTPCIYDLSFEATGDNISVQMHGVWTAAGKIGPTIQNCYFYNSSATTTTAKCISLSGVWAANITSNHFLGRGGGGSPTTGIGGYGIFILLGNDMNTSVMNLDISNNEFLTLAHPYWASDRTLVTGGRVEGISISNNSFVAGYRAIRSSQGLATLVGNNIISDFDTGIEFIDEFDFNITGNTEVDGSTVGIKLSVATGICERGVICGNNIKAASTGNIGVELINNVAASRLRSISITGNIFGRAAGGATTSVGVKFNNTFNIENITITGNTFQQLLTAVDTGSVTGQINTINANNCVFVTNPTPILSSGYALTATYTLTGGSSSEDVNIPIPAGLFFKPPITGYCMEDGSLGTKIIGFFKSSAVTPATTKTNAVFTLRTMDGVAIPLGRTVRLNTYLIGY
jgi:hypothetical protein